MGCNQLNLNRRFDDVDFDFHGAGNKPSPLGGNVFSKYFLQLRRNFLLFFYNCLQI